MSFALCVQSIKNIYIYIANVVGSTNRSSFVRKVARLKHYSRTRKHGCEETCQNHQ